MPTESLKIKGQFFNLRTELLLSPSKGYKPVKSEISRGYNQVLYNDDEANIREVCEILKRNVVVLELNFDRWNLITSKSFESKKVDITKIISKKFRFTYY